MVDLKTVESWADEAILSPGAPAEMADLCLATRAGERITSRILSGLGGAPSALDVMRAIAVMRVHDASQDEMRRLADNLDPIVREVDAGEALPTLMKPLLSLARDFWQARMISSRAMDEVQERMRDLLHAMKEFAAELPEEKPAAPEPVVHTISKFICQILSKQYLRFRIEIHQTLGRSKLRNFNQFLGRVIRKIVLHHKSRFQPWI